MSPQYDYIMETPEEGSPYFIDQYGTLYRKWEICQSGHGSAMFTYFYREVFSKSPVIINSDHVQQIYVAKGDEEGRVIVVLGILAWWIF